MRKFVSALALGAGMIAGTTASAQVTDVRIVTETGPAVNPDPDFSPTLTYYGVDYLNGLIANDILISFSGQYSGSQLILQLESGSLFRHDEGNTTSGPGDATPAGVPVDPSAIYPSLSFDTFFGSGVPGGGAVDIDNSFGDSNSIPNDTVNGPFTLTSAWNPPGGAGPSDLVDLTTARVVLSDDATGTWSFLSSANNVISPITGGTIENGVLVIPEPTTASLLGLAGLSLIARRRKTA